MMEAKGLIVETIDEIRWKVTAPNGASLFYFPGGTLAKGKRMG
jgi:hypothetical protein